MSETKKINLTGDRPLSKGEADKLAKWWQSKGWDVQKTFAYRRGGRAFVHLTATSNESELNFKNWISEAVV